MQPIHYLPGGDPPHTVASSLKEIIREEGIFSRNGTAMTGIS
jgi:hypothetical protein